MSGQMHFVHTVRRWFSAWKPPRLISSGLPTRFTQRRVRDLARLNRALQAEILERKATQEEAARSFHFVSFLSRSATHFIDQSHRGDLFAYVADQVASLVPGALVAATEFDASQNRLVVRAVGGDASQVARIPTILGRDPIGLTVEFKEEYREQWGAGGLVKNPERLRDVVLEGFPPPMCRHLEMTLDVHDVYTIPFTRQDDFLGIVAILTRTPAPPANAPLIEAFVRHSAIALQNRRHQEAHRKAEERYRTIVETAQEGIWTFDADYRTTYVNRKMAEMLNLTVSEMLGRPVFDFQHKDEQDPTRQYVEQFRKGIPDVWECPLHRQDGTRLWVLISATPQFSAQGRYTGALCMVTDLTHRKQAEDELKALNETLEKRVANRTIMAERRAAQLRALHAKLTQAEQRERRRLAEVLHDHLQQVLAAARLRVDLLLQHAAEESLRQSLREIRELLRESIQASRSLTVELSPPILYELGLAAALNWLAQWMKEKHGLTVTMDLDVRAEPTAEDVKVLLFQAVRELLFNVVKHARVSEARIRLVPGEGNCTVLAVHDAGAGFHPDSREASGIRTEGFGLFSIRERLEWIGGRMEIQSAPGQGTTVSLFAPHTGK